MRSELITDQTLEWTNRLVPNAGAIGATAIGLATAICVQAELQPSEQLGIAVARAAQKYELMGRRFFEEIAEITDQWIRQQHAKGLAGRATVREAIRGGAK